MRDALILAGLTIGAVAAFFPGGSDGAAERPGPSVTGPAAPATGMAPPTAQAMASGPIELRRASDGHFYAPVTVGARPVTMLVDTGASVVALTGEDARLAGVDWNPGQLTVVAQGAGGPVRGVAVTLDRVQLGGREARGVAAVIIPEGLPVSLLGQSFLAGLAPMRIEKDRMVIGDQK